MLSSLQSFLIANPLVELGVVTMILVVFGFIAKLLKQPVLVGYIVAGVLMSPQVFDFITHQKHIAIYAHFGVSLLLFMVGLGLNPKIIKEVGKVSAIAGVGQVIFTSLIGFGVALLLGFDSIISLYIAIALTFSSTIVIVKLVSDRGDTNSVYGKIALGILIVQDIIAMLILMAISATMMEVGDGGMGLFIARIIGSIIVLGAFVRLMTIRVLPKIMTYLAHNRELMLLFVVTWAVLLGGIRYYSGFSMEIGALLAGISLASSRYRFHIFNELRPLRDFFVALFFVYLGSQVVFDNIGLYVVPIIIFSLFVLVGNPFIVILLMSRLGYSSKTGFMTGLTVAQISEFSFIVIGLAVAAGHITDPVVLSVVTVIGLITMTGSSYLFAYADGLYNYLSPYLHRFEPQNPLHEAADTDEQVDVVILGYNRIGTYLADKYQQAGLKVAVIDHNPENIEKAAQKGFIARYGEATNEEILEEMFTHDTKWICCTIDDYDTNAHILHTGKEQSPNAKIILLAMYVEEAEELYRHHADYVIVPHYSGALQSRMIIESLDRDDVQHAYMFHNQLLEHKSTFG